MMADQEILVVGVPPEPVVYLPLFCVDFDGVFHTYRKWGVVDGPPIEGSIEWLVMAALDERCEVAIYSARSCLPEQLKQMKEWIHKNLVNFLLSRQSPLVEAIDAAAAIFAKLQFPTEKPVGHIYIDDRAHCFQGKFRSIDWYLGFKPWDKRHPEEDVPDYNLTGVTEFDEEHADEMLECLLDCLITDRDGYNTFEPSAHQYVACMVRDVRESTLTLRQGRRPIRDVIHAALSDMSSKCLDDEEDKEAVFQHIMKEIAQSAYGEDCEDRAHS